MKLTDTNIVEQEYTLELLHEMFKPRFHKYLENAFFNDDPHFYVQLFGSKYVNMNMRKLKKSLPSYNIFLDVIDGVLYKPTALNHDDVRFINSMLKYDKGLGKHLADVFDMSMYNAEKDFERQRLMMEYGTRGKNKEYLEDLYRKIRYDLKHSSIEDEEYSVVTRVIDLVKDSERITRECIRHLFTSYTPNPTTYGRPILTAHLITRFERYISERIDDNYICKALFSHELCHTNGVDGMINLFVDNSNYITESWCETVDKNLYRFITCLVYSMKNRVTEKDVERYKRNAKKNIDNKISTEKF